MSSKESTNKKNENDESLCKDTLNYERLRYMSKGWGLFFSVLYFTAFFVLVPKFLLLFYPEKITNEGVFEFWSQLLINHITYYLVSLAYCVLYYIRHPFFEKYKVTTDPWPWDDPKINWPELRWSTIKTLFINHNIVLPIIALEGVITGECKYRTSYDELPSYIEMFTHIFIFMVMDDITFYWSHRLFHWDAIYPWLHKQHHAYVNPVAFSNAYAHPLEYVVGNVMTSFSGPLLLRKKIHFFTIWVYTIFRVYETAEGHSGYEFPWSMFRLLPLSGSTEFHHYHHKSFKGNYASFFTYWDRICGTVAKPYIEYTKRKEELTYSKEEGVDNKSDRQVHKEIKKKS